MKLFLFTLMALFMMFSQLSQSTLADEAMLSQTTQAGQTATYSLELHNDTTSNHDYSLTLSGLPDAVTQTFSQGGPIIESVSIPANSYGQIMVNVNVPVDTPVGHYLASFRAMRDDNTEVTIPIALTVENTYSLRITSQNVNINTFNGQDFTFEVSAANTGALPVTNLAITVNAPARWIAQVDPITLNQLAPDTTTTFTVHVLVPATQGAIQQTLTLNANSDQAKSPETSVLVRVQTSPNYFLYAGLISVVAVAGAVVYFRIKGRR